MAMGRWGSARPRLAWRQAVIVTALAAGTTGALITSVTQAGAASDRPAPARRLPPDFARIITEAAVTQAPLVTDFAGQSDQARSKRGLAAPPGSRAMRRANRKKQAMARRYLRHGHPPAARALARTQRAQFRGNYCGPAMVSEMLAQMRVRLSQRAAARALHTNRSGTDWSNSRGYPVPRVLNAHQRRNKYVAVGLPWSPTRKQVRTFITDLVTDINRRHGVPIAGNAYEIPGGPHLAGHPPGQAIMHWFDIRGYARSGAITRYEDSVHGAPSVGWSAGVPAYSALPSRTIVYILGARGYVW